MSGSIIIYLGIGLAKRYHNPVIVLNDIVRKIMMSFCFVPGSFIDVQYKDVF